ncbi:molybdenum cofactor guanylyltransferase MobA [Pseudomonas sp. BN102]|uniref:molybdenum cofactor guanylyltransferase MobA n=1 Tax=Pseudomonas sp. BN102 TaxID=2567886 RepID=UPI002454EDAD|nr:molybdenum cofactor guanylyltransferase MobA [Pseudomonas sp. BN102]MDH4609351.1 molybdenum cofactor guanylyltransferase MobA [Pseudomonas sp. BN102]
MPDMPLPPCSILLLCGGRGQRMGGRDKGLLEWQGRPLIAWLHERVRPLTDDLIISCNRNAERYAAWADQLVQDDSPDYPGPLAGIRAGLAVARHEQVLVLPCDAPLVDDALIDSLLHAACERPVMLRQGKFWEPLFCVLPRALLPALDAGWRAGERSPQRIFRQLDPVAVDCPEGDPRLANINTPELLGDNQLKN